LNINKCSSFSFSLKKHTLLFNYCLDNLKLSGKNVIDDLYVIFDSKLSIKYHVDSIKDKSYMKLKLIKGMCTNFND